MKTKQVEEGGYNQWYNESLGKDVFPIFLGDDDLIAKLLDEIMVISENKLSGNVSDSEVLDPEWECFVMNVMVIRF